MQKLQIALVSAAVCLLAAIGIGTASASSGPDVVEMYQGDGFTFDPLSWSPLPALSGTADGTTTRVTVAIQDVATGNWWHPNNNCGASDYPTCAQGTLIGPWEKNDARLFPIQNVADTRLFSFRFDLPDGTYNVGVRAYDEYGNTGKNVWQRIVVETSEPPAPAPFGIGISEPSAGQMFNEGLIVMNGGLDDPATTRVAIYNRDIKKWVDPDGAALSAWQAFGAEVVANDPFSFEWQHDVRLPPGRYAYGADAFDDDGQKIGSTPWTYFTVKPCSVRCANLSLDTLDNGVVFDDNQVCFSATSDAFTKGGSVRLAVRDKATGEWLKGSPLAFSPGWGQFDNLGSLLQAGPESRDSCFNEAPLDFAAGSYNLGVKTYDADGVEGPKAWISFTVTN